MTEKDTDIIDLFISHICPDWSYRQVGRGKGWVEIYNEDDEKVAEVQFGYDKF